MRLSYRHIIATLAALAALLSCSGNGSSETDNPQPGSGTETPQPGTDQPDTDQPGTDQPGETQAGADPFNTTPDLDLSENWTRDDQPTQEDTVWFSNPVYKDYVFADPSILRYGDTFYCYSTGNNYRIIKSPDMIHWTYVGTVFTDANRPQWIKEPGGKSAALWGPEVRAIHGKIYFYYTISSASGKGIGVATAPSPEGPFTDHGKIIQDGDYGTKGLACAGATYFLDDDGRQYLYWGSYKSIWVAELSDDALSVRYPCDSTKITRVAGAAWEGTMFHKHGQYYYFIGSGGYCCSGENSDYNMQVGRATSATGPFYNKKGVNLLNTAGTFSLAQGNDYFVGPGSPGAVITDDQAEHAASVRQLALDHHARHVGESLRANVLRGALRARLG